MTIAHYDLYAGFDLGDLFGYAIHDGKTIIVAGSISLHKHKYNLAGKYRHLAKFLQDVCHISWVHAFAHEPMMRGPNARPEIVANQGSLRAIVHLAMGPNRHFHQCAPNTLKKFATGNGRADKEAVMCAAQQQYPNIHVNSQDQADAMFLSAWAASKYRIEAA